MLKIYDSNRWNLWDQSLWFIRYGVWMWLGDLKWRIPNWWQRGQRGWGDADTWGLDSYLARVIRDSIKHLRTYVHGHPTLLEPITGNFVDDMDKWKYILDTIVETFETVLKIINIELQYIPSENYTENWFNDTTRKWKGFNKKNPDIKTRPMTLNEIKKYEEGWNYFKKYFCTLWD